MSRNSVLIIPSLNPDEHLITYVKELAANGFSDMILVDDGSSPGSQAVFETLRAMPECDLFVHTVNMGKGRSLKDAFNYYCQKYAGRYHGVITADSDGQHTVADIIRLDDALLESPEALILGVRDFDHPSVPFKSRFGNKITKYVLGLFIGRMRQSGGQRRIVISDTQTGLRAIPNALITDYLTLAGERFEYETNMLIEAQHMQTPVKEVQIQTVYINDNSETHFRPLADSFAIYRLIFSAFLKYTFSSLTAFLIDYSLYAMFVYFLGFLALGPKIFLASAAARAVSSLYNYTVNRSLVFSGGGGHKKTLGKYYTLCILQLCCSALLVWTICRYLYLSEVTVKLFVDMFLFVISYYLQKNWVFREKNTELEHPAIGYGQLKLKKI